MRRLGIKGLVSVAVGVLAVSFCPSAGSARARMPKPVISGFQASPSTVASGGSTTVTATVSGGSICTLSANKPLPGLPATFSCEGETSSVARSLTVPANIGKKPVAYKLHLAANRAGQNAKASLSVSVSRLVPDTRVAAGTSHTCAVVSTGHIECWGANESGQLGDGTTSESDKPVEVKRITDAGQVAAGEIHTCAVLFSGHIECWGANGSRQLGDGTMRELSDTPVEVRGITDATQVTGGGNHTCALLSTGHIECWGANEAGQLGDGATRSSELPVEVEHVTTATYVSAGDSYTCAALSSGHVECWGEGSSGQLGNGHNGHEPTDSPVEVLGITDATEVAAASEGACAVLSTGHVECWGANESGTLGDGTTSWSDIPVAVQHITNAIEVAAGGDHTCAALSTGRVACWGANRSGQLGDGISGEDSYLPVEVQGTMGASQVTAGRSHTCAVLSSRKIECWGDNRSGELGNGTTGREPSSTPLEVLGITDATQDSATCADLATGHIDCWGATRGNQVDAPVEVQGVTSATQVAAGSATCAVLSSGHVDCWGANRLGQLGDGTTTEFSDAPVEVLGINNATEVAAGGSFACAVLSSGHIECWGENYYGELGDGITSESSDTPVEVLGINNATEVAAGGSFVCAVLSSGHIECWGENYQGQLGDGTKLVRPDRPVEVLGITNATEVAAGGDVLSGHACALLATGHIQCWGANGFGELGDGGNANADTAVEVRGVTNAAQVSAAAAETCAVLSGGRIDCWGENSNGQLGDGTTSEYSNTPVEVQGITDGTQVAAGESYTCTVLSTGHIECWGGDRYGQLGTGTAWATIPTEVLGIP